MNFDDLDVITGAVLVHDRIQRCFDAQYEAELATRRWKIAHGYCGGRIYCLTFMRKGAKHESCAKCRKEGNPKFRTRTNKRSAYGEMQKRFCAEGRK